MPNNARTSYKKADLIMAVQELLQTSSVETQEEMREKLYKQGFNVNQVKISRLLHKLGAIKVNEKEHTVYRLPTEFMAVKPSDSLRHLILNIKNNESIIVIQTAPGSAQLVARLLDQKKDIGILGTIAGDDTIFVAPEKIQHTQLVIKKIYKLLLE